LAVTDALKVVCAQGIRKFLWEGGNRDEKISFSLSGGVEFAIRGGAIAAADPSPEEVIAKWCADLDHYNHLVTLAFDLIQENANEIWEAENELDSLRAQRKQLKGDKKAKRKTSKAIRKAKQFISDLEDEGDWLLWYLGDARTMRDWHEWENLPYPKQYLNCS